MLRKKLITLAGIAVLAMGISSQASADPIIHVGYNIVDTLTTDVGGNPIFNYLFRFTYEGCDLVPAGPVTVGNCSAADALIGIDLSFLGDDVLSFVQVVLPGTSAGLWDIVDILQPGIDGIIGLTSFAGVDALAVFDVGVQVVGSATSGGALPDFDFWEFVFDGFDVFAFADFEENLQISFDFPATEVPEPGTLTLFGLGLLGIGAARRRRNKIA